MKVLLDAIRHEHRKILMLHQYGEHAMRATFPEIVVIQSAENDVRIPREKLHATTIRLNRTASGPILFRVPIPIIATVVAEQHVIDIVDNIDPALELFVVGAGVSHCRPGSHVTTTDPLAFVDGHIVAFLATEIRGKVILSIAFKKLIVAPVGAIDIHVSPPSTERFMAHEKLHVADPAIAEILTIARRLWVIRSTKIEETIMRTTP